MATTICPSCGTRNADTAGTCRRCKATLPSTTGAPTLRGTPHALASDAIDVLLDGRWRIEEPLGGAAHPHLFLGRDEETARTVIIKRLDAESARDRAIRSRFLKEAEIVARLEHPGLIHILDVASKNTTPALVMAYPAGETLQDLIARKKHLPVAVALWLVDQLLDTLDFLHANGIFHRNLRADNIFIGPHARTGLPHLTLSDFVMAHTVAPRRRGGDTQTLMGMKMNDTLSYVQPSPYVAPELLSEESDSRSDLYSVGVILFELLTGRPPLANVQDPDQMMRSIRQERPTGLRMVRPEAPPKLEAVLERLLSKNPDDRYFDVDQTRAALRKAAPEQMIPIAQGPFLRGSAPDDSDARPEEKPMRKVSLRAYFIDRTPVTVAQYARWLEATGRKAPEGWETYNDTARNADHPVVFVSWQDAADYALWAGKRLPTEAEWEKAARGTDGRTYPWGNDPPTLEHACFGGQRSTNSVLAHPMGASPYGVLDMAGNAFEWVEDWYNKKMYQMVGDQDPVGPASGRKKVLRGGSFVHDAFALRCATRGRYAPHERRANHSFRCVWSLH